MPHPSASRTILPLFAAALLGGGVAAVATVLFDDGRQDPVHTTTVVRQAALASTASDRQTVNEGLTAADIYKRYAPGVAYVRAEITTQVSSPFDLFPQQEQSEATGSGFVVDSQGDILTNNHVIDGAGTVTVQFGGKEQLVAKVVGRDPATDLALLHVVKGTTPAPLPLGSSKDVQVGDPTIAIGNPFGLDRTLTTGVVSALQREIEAPNGLGGIKNVIQTDAAINPGNSGGPLIDAAGRVIGINSQIETGGSGSEGSVGIGFAVPIDTAKSILARLKQGGEVQHAYLGVNSLTIDHSLDSLDLSVDHGVLLQSVVPGGPAATAGLLAGNLNAELTGSDGKSVPITIGGDVITEIDGIAVKTSEQLSALVEAHKPGDKVKLQIVRKTRKFTVTVTLASHPATLPNG